MKCKHCEYEMGILVKFNLQSNDYRMAGNYCSRKCMSERRATLSPFKDPKKVREAIIKRDYEILKRMDDPPTPTTEVVIQDGMDQGFNILFGLPPKKAEDEEEEEEEVNPFNKLFG